MWPVAESHAFRQDETATLLCNVPSGECSDRAGAVRTGDDTALVFAAPERGRR